MESSVKVSRKSLSGTALQLPEIMKSGSRTEKKSPSNRLSEEALVSRLEALKKLRLGAYSITSTVIHRAGKKGYLAVYAFCADCKRTREVLVGNIESGRTTRCKCNPPTKHSDPRARMLSARFTAIKQRCKNPKHPSYPRYGGRGIRCFFKSSRQFIAYVLKHLPHPTYRNLDIGRIRNDGHYIAGNIELQTRPVNQRNKCSNHYVGYKGRKIVAADLHAALKADYPDFRLSAAATAQLAGQDVPWQEILKRKARGQYGSRPSTT